jgi:hypothetical protein
MFSTSDLSAEQICSFANLVIQDPKLLEQLLQIVYGLLQENLIYGHERTAYEKRN